MPPPAAIPPAYDPSFYGPLGPAQPATRLRLVKLLLVVGLLGGGLIATYWVAVKAGWLTPVAQKATIDTSHQNGIKSAIKYPVEPKAQLAATNGGDPDADWKAWVKKKLFEHETKLNDHENRLKALEAAKKGQPAPAPQAPAQSKTPKPTQYRSAQFISHKVTDKAVDDPDTYLLAPGSTKLACTVETQMSSDVESYFTAKVRANIYDTASGGQLLIPQGSTILGKYHSQQLLFGNERLPTTSLVVSLPNGKSYELGDAPVMDGTGQAGLVSRIDNHWARLFGSIVIMGVLRGGQAALYTSLTPNDASGAVAAGIAATTNQAAQMRLAPALSTKPTIYVEAGSPCQVILTRELKLPSYRRS
jgi:type IV secretory pathway VirB10-like protein